MSSLIIWNANCKRCSCKMVRGVFSKLNWPFTDVYQMHMLPFWNIYLGHRYRIWMQQLLGIIHPSYLAQDSLLNSFWFKVCFDSFLIICFIFPMYRLDMAKLLE